MARGGSWAIFGRDKTGPEAANTVDCAVIGALLPVKAVVRLLREAGAVGGLARDGRGFISRMQFKSASSLRKACFGKFCGSGRG